MLMAEMKNICGKIPVELHEKVRAEIEEKETSTQIFIRQVIEEHFNRLEGKGEESMEKRTLAVQVTEELFQRVKWVVAKEGIKQKDFIIRIIEKAVEEVEAKWQELEQPEETVETDRLEEAEEISEEEIAEEGIEGTEAAEEEPDNENFEESAQLEEGEPDSELPEDAEEEEELPESDGRNRRDRIMPTNRTYKTSRRCGRKTMPPAFFIQQRRLIAATIRFLIIQRIGGFREGLRRAGGFTCVGHCEVDAYADKNYRLLFDTEGEWFCNDARTIETERMPDFDLLCAGFPCQAFSIAGKREGFADARGTLFFEIARLVADKRPAYFILENVPGLLSHDKGRTFHTILSTLSELGYGVEWKVLNSKDFGVPQARKRVYIVGYLDGRCAGKILPFPTANGTPLVQIQTGRQGERIYKAEGLSCTLTSGAGGVGGKTGLYEVGVPIKENTKQGYKMAYPGDSIDLGYAGLNTRRGRVGIRSPIP